MKRCLHCERPAALSLCVVISTLGISKRRQKCTGSLPFCFSCLHQVCAESDGCLAIQIRESLQAALHALTEHRLSQPKLEPHPEQKGNGLEAEKFS